VEALATAIDAKDQTTHFHVRRVQLYCERMGELMGLAAAEIKALKAGALLHDIGKVAMPDSLIHKPGKLTEEEIAIIRTHARVGHDIIAAVPVLRGAARVVLHSHEAWDGTGYPAGLSGNEIHIGSRITAVVDTFDALTWGRCYRNPVSVEHAASELRRCAGSQFDPTAVEAWLALAAPVAEL
jgi:HD-GYP domain-containing protein (c-di-GMP phosphodiesterase class II)